MTLSVINQLELFDMKIVRIIASYMLPLFLVLFGLNERSFAAQYIGCYTDNNIRALPAVLGDGMSVQKCVDTALAKGFPYAGLQFQGQCYAGNIPGYQKLDNDAAECNTPCITNKTDGKSDMCGGVWRNSIYATGLPVVLQGQKGDKGDTGPSGQRGLQGLQGAKGDKGNKGDPGPAIKTVAVCTTDLVLGGASCYCSSGTLVIHQSAPCTVTSDTGSCTGLNKGTCCVCIPRP